MSILWSQIKDNNITKFIYLMELNRYIYILLAFYFFYFARGTDGKFQDSDKIIVLLSQIKMKDWYNMYEWTGLKCMQ